MGCEAEIDYKDIEGLEEKGRGTSSVLPHPLSGRGNTVKLQWRKVSLSEAPPEAKLPPTQTTFGLQVRDTSPPPSFSLHAQGQLPTEPSRLAAEELALG